MAERRLDVTAYMAYWAFRVRTNQFVKSCKMLPVFSWPMCLTSWKYWTFKMLVRYILSSMCLRLSQFSQLSFMQYMGPSVFPLLISLVMIVRICVLYLIIIIKSVVWNICHCLGLGHAKIGMHWISFYVLLYKDVPSAHTSSTITPGYSFQWRCVFRFQCGFRFRFRFTKLI